jgi:hypothetical protein
MKFYRFTSWGVLTNWGRYSPLEKELLELEDEVNTAIRKLEPSVRNEAKIKTLIKRFLAIQTNTSVEQKDYEALKVELTSMLAQVKERLLKELLELKNKVIELENQVKTAIKKLEPFVRDTAPAEKNLKILTSRFEDIQRYVSGEQKDYEAWKVELTSILAGINELRLNRLDKGGKGIPKAPRTFHNLQANNLVSEIRAHLGYRKMNRAVEDPFLAGFVIHYQADLKEAGAKNFHAMIATGKPVLWALDVDRYLSIGDPLSNKHGVVAAGKDVYGAGVAKLEDASAGRTEIYLTMKDCEDRANILEAMINRKEYSESGRENVKVLRDQAKDYSTTLNGWTPSLVQQIQKTIVLNFESGHYSPSQSWRESAKAWTKAGYIVKWDRESLYV